MILAGKIRCKQLNSYPISCQGFSESQIYLTKPKDAQDWAFTFSFMPWHLIRAHGEGTYRTSIKKAIQYDFRRSLESYVQSIPRHCLETLNIACSIWFVRQLELSSSPRRMLHHSSFCAAGYAEYDDNDPRTPKCELLRANHIANCPEIRIWPTPNWLQNSDLRPARKASEKHLFFNRSSSLWAQAFKS